MMLKTFVTVSDDDDGNNGGEYAVGVDETWWVMTEEASNFVAGVVVATVMTIMKMLVEVEVMSHHG